MSNIIKEDSKYISYLENMVIMLSKCYQETHDMLLKKLKANETNAYMEMPTVQGTEMRISVEKIAEKAKNFGFVNAEDLDGFTEILISKYNR